MLVMQFSFEERKPANLGNETNMGAGTESNVYNILEIFKIPSSSIVKKNILIKEKACSTRYHILTRFEEPSNTTVSIFRVPNKFLN